MQAPNTIKITIVERHELSRAAYRLFFATDPRFEIVAEVETIEDAGSQIPLTQPRVILIHAKHPETECDQIKLMKQSFPQVQVLALTDTEDSATIGRLVSAGVSGCCSSNVSVQNLLVAVSAVAVGGMWFGPSLAATMRAVLRGDGVPGQPVGEAAPRPVLTERESEILRRLAQGLTNQQIAERLHLSVETVKTYIRRIMDKSSVRRRQDLVARYRSKTGA